MEYILWLLDNMAYQYMTMGWVGSWVHTWTRNLSFLYILVYWHGVLCIFLYTGMVYSVYSCILAWYTLYCCVIVGFCLHFLKYRIAGNIGECFNLANWRFEKNAKFKPL